MQAFNLDITKKGVVPLLYAKQRDVGTKIEITITDNGSKYDLANMSLSVWYSGKSGEGNYTTIDDKSAFTVSGNVVVVELIMQMLNLPGEHLMCLVMNGTDGSQLGLWNIPYYVEAIPGADSVAAQQYYQAFLAAQKKAEEAAQVAEDAQEHANAAAQTAVDAAARAENLSAETADAAARAEEDADRAERAAESVDKATLAQMQELIAGAENLSAETADAAARAEAAAEKLEGGLVLKKGGGLDSIVQVITPELDANGQPKDNQSKATAEGAVALGKYNAVSGKNGCAVNYNNKVSGERAFAANGYNEVSGMYGAALGYQNVVSAERAFACGSGNEVSGGRAFGTGISNKVNAVNGFATGNTNTVKDTAENGAAFGFANEVSGKHAFAMGENNQVGGLDAFVGGYNNRARGNYGFVAGTNNIVEEGIENATVFGASNIVRGGGGCFVNGANNQVIGVYGTAFGAHNVVYGGSTFAAGEHLFAINKSQAVFGAYNDPNTSALFVIGNGTSEDDRSNAFEVFADGIVQVNNKDYLNPPMKMGLEYRTAERYNGKAVYAKLIDAGFTYKGQTNIEHKLAVVTPISIEVTNNNQEVVTTGGNITNLVFNRTYIYVTCAVDHGNLVFLVKYTKE